MCMNSEKTIPCYITNTIIKLSDLKPGDKVMIHLYCGEPEFGVVMRNGEDLSVVSLKTDVMYNLNKITSRVKV